MENIKAAIAGVDGWLTAFTLAGTTPIAGQRQRNEIAALAAHVADVEKLNDVVREGIQPQTVPEGDDVMSRMIRAVAEAPAPPDMKGPLAIVSGWLDGEAPELPADAIAAVNVLLVEAERIEAHREKMVGGIQIGSIGASMATMTVGGRFQAAGGEAATRLPAGLQHLDAGPVQAAADELSRAVREHFNRPE